MPKSDTEELVLYGEGDMIPSLDLTSQEVSEAMRELTKSDSGGLAITFVKLLRETPRLKTQQGYGSNGITLAEEDRVYLTKVRDLSTRNLWSPDKDLKAPVCVAVAHSDVNKLRGVWQHPTMEAPEAFEESPSGELSCECSQCPLSKFESAAAWSDKPGSKGQACRLTRMVIGLPMTPSGKRFTDPLKRSNEQQFFVPIKDYQNEDSPQGAIILVVNPTSLSASKTMAQELVERNSASNLLARQGKKVPPYLEAVVFQIKGRKEKGGQFEYNVLEAESVGMVSPLHFRDHQARFLEASKWTDHLIGSDMVTEIIVDDSEESDEDRKSKAQRGSRRKADQNHGDKQEQGEENIPF